MQIEKEYIQDMWKWRVPICEIAKALDRKDCTVRAYISRCCKKLPPLRAYNYALDVSPLIAPRTRSRLTVRCVKFMRSAYIMGYTASEIGESVGLTKETTLRVLEEHGAYRRRAMEIPKWYQMRNCLDASMFR